MKNLIKEEIFRKQFDGEYADVHYYDLPVDIQINDIIHINREDEYYSENNSYDAYTELVIIREREETDDEYQKRISLVEKCKKQAKQMRYQTYLKLKTEFENNENIFSN